MVSVRSLSPRAGRYLSRCGSDDPLVQANRLIDEAVVLQDRGLCDAADRLLAEAEALLELEDAA